MKSLTYIPLEPYRQRYTEQLSVADGWAEKAFSKKFNVKPLRPDNSSVSFNLTSGQVLDTLQRPLWALEQTKMLLREPATQALYFDDMYHPGLDALIYSQKNKDYSCVAAFCWAQTFDGYDFTKKFQWMRAWEIMAVIGAYTDIFVASNMLKELIHAALFGMDIRVHCVGLPFSSEAVRKTSDPTFNPDPVDVVWSSRMDTEKNFSFFVALVEQMPNLKFAICTGHDQLRGTDTKGLAMLNHFMSNNRLPNLTIHTGLTKAQYYEVLRKSTMQFNCADQDWVSFTLLEALACGCLPIYPLFRSFAEVFSSCPMLTYQHKKLMSAMEVIQGVIDGVDSQLLDTARAHYESILMFHDGTLDRISTILQGETI